jgi:hypothetical protein
MFFGRMEYYCQNETARILFKGYPFFCEHNPSPAMDLHHVVVIAHQFLHLLRGTDGNGLAELDPVGGSAQMAMLP